MLFLQFAHWNNFRVGPKLLVVAVGYIGLDVEIFQQSDAHIHFERNVPGSQTSSLIRV